MAALIPLAALALPPLLHAYWTLATGAVASLLLPGHVVPPRFKAAVRLASHRGKTWEGGGGGRDGAPLGRRVSAWSVPQRWFLHFYVLGVATTTAVLLAYGRLVLGEEGGGGGRSWWRRHLVPAAAGMAAPLTPARARALAALALLWLHLARRLGECALVTKWPAGARMHGLAYLFSISYYTVLPLSFLPEADFGPLAASLAAGHSGGTTVASLARAAAARLPPALAAAAAPAAGALLFAAGSALQAWAHVALADLQRTAAQAGTPYALPDRGLLARLTCPHYAGEILLYAGLAVVAAAGGGGGAPARLLPWLVLAWVVCNLVLGAADAEAWYRRTFGRAWVPRAKLVPGVW